MFEIKRIQNMNWRALYPGLNLIQEVYFPIHSEKKFPTSNGELHYTPRNTRNAFSCSYILSKIYYKFSTFSNKRFLMFQCVNNSALDQFLLLLVLLFSPFQVINITMHKDSVSYLTLCFKYIYTSCY